MEAIKTTLWGNPQNTNGEHSEVHKSMIDDNVTETKYNGRTESDPDAEGAYQPGQGDTARRPQGSISTDGQSQGTNKNPFSSSNEPTTGFGGIGAQPSVTADPSSGQQNTQKHQGADRPNAEPATNASTGSGESLDSMGSTGSAPSESMGGGGMKLPDSENTSVGEGTGTLYEKSTGLHCDGGDFDATRPGAAREAARLMDEKGFKHGDQKAAGETEDQSQEKKWYGVDHSGFGGHGSHQNKRPSVTSINQDERPLGNEKNEYDQTTTNTEKKGLGQKIKEKLHHSS